MNQLYAWEFQLNTNTHSGRDFELLSKLARLIARYFLLLFNNTQCLNDTVSYMPRPMVFHVVGSEGSIYMISRPYFKSHVAVSLGGEALQLDVPNMNVTSPMSLRSNTLFLTSLESGYRHRLIRLFQIPHVLLGQLHVYRSYIL